MDIIPGLRSTSDALCAEKVQMNLIAQNIANAQTTRDVNGQAYKRKVATFETYMPQDKRGSENSQDPAIQSVRVGNIFEDKTPGIKIYDPTHPHADKDGFVEQSNVNMANEMVDLIDCSHAYQANLAVVRTSKQITQQILQIGK
ncbi:MAG: flagellar basal body rod protein FlgC [Verrucomicrobia bacterium GWC2_42_7]|nr:MAG: flagellar basal body rod protein FlgC [Verrucomicrobia bacterium GWC2_42_7]